MAEKAVILYHDMRVHENFEQCSQRLFSVTKKACEEWPEKPRILVLDIQGHRNSQGGYDADAYEILKEFIMTVLMPFLAEASTPLYRITNPRGQRNDIPDVLVVEAPDRGSRNTSRDRNPIRARASRVCGRSPTTWGSMIRVA